MGNSLHKGYSVARPRLGKTPRAFTAVELVVSIAVFLAVATFVTIVIATSLGGAAQLDRARAGSEVSFDMLAALNSYSYSEILANDFTVPAACSSSDSGKGAAGESCVARPAGDIQVKYYYADAEGLCPDLQSNPAFVSPATGTLQASSLGEITVCATPLNRDDTPNTDAVMQSTSFVAPWPDYDPTKARIRVLLTSDLPTPPSAVYLVRSANTAQLVPGSTPATFTDGVAEFEVTPATQCSVTDPCQVALAPGTTSPSLSGGVALFGTAATAAAKLNPPAGEVTVVNVIAANPSSLTVELATSKGGTPADNTVCLSAELSSTPAYPLFNCNIGSSVVFDTANVNGVSYPVAPADSMVVYLDTPSQTCPATGRTVNSSGQWSTKRVCTSWTWGTTSDLPVTAAAPATITVNFDRVSPANGFGGASSWSQPRLTPGCAATALCAPVTTVPEVELCGGQACLSVAP